MTDLYDTLPDLMRRATENVVPESADLLERSIRRGAAVRRRRRTALLGFTGAGAALAIITGVVAGPNLPGDGSGGAGTVAGTPPVPASVTQGPTVKPDPASVTPSDTLETLKKLLPDGLDVSKPEMRYVKEGNSIEVSVLVDDGKGASQFSVQLRTERHPRPVNCADKPHNCRIRSDGSSVTTSVNLLHKRDRSGHRNNHVVIQRVDGTSIALANTNTPSPQMTGITRPQPVFSVAQLTRMADSKLWKYPPMSQN